MGNFLPACAASDVPKDGVLGVEVGGEPVAIVFTDDEYFAIRDVCSHADVPLSEGDVEDCTIECWLHGSSFDLRTGRPTALPAVRPVPVYPVRVTDGTVFVDVTQESSQ
jgi:3-phenylpropionate/trans-cinnamate dioxygenase ferredoxin subunit